MWSGDAYHLTFKFLKSTPDQNCIQSCNYLLQNSDINKTSSIGSSEKI